MILFCDFSLLFFFFRSSDSSQFLQWIATRQSITLYTASKSLRKMENVSIYCHDKLISPLFHPSRTFHHPFSYRQQREWILFKCSTKQFSDMRAMCVMSSERYGRAWNVLCKSEAALSCSQSAQRVQPLANLFRLLNVLSLACRVCIILVVCRV